MKRGAFFAVASIGSLAAAPPRRLANAQKGTAPFKTAEIDVAGNKIFYRGYGQGPAILIVHGFPRTSLMWRIPAPKLAKNHTVICVDLRAYGKSGIPASADDHFPYSKRATAKELVQVMVKLGFPNFKLIGHDRGGRVAYRMALDHPKNVERLAVFDVIPIFEAWSRSDVRFAQTLLALDSLIAETAVTGELLARRSGSRLPQSLRTRFSRPRDSRRIRFHLSRSGPRSWNL